MATADPVQRTREKLVLILDTAATVVALTGRASGNVVPSFAAATASLPAIAYTVVTAPIIGGDGVRWRFSVQFDAFAATEAVANELLHAVTTAVTSSALAAEPQPIDAHPVRVMRRGATTTEGPARATLDLALEAQF